MRTRTQFLYSLLLLALLCMPAHAAEFAPLGSNPNFSHLMMDATHTVGEIFATTQDSNGFIWFGGKSGLARYDGYRFKIYTIHPGDPHSLRANHITYLYEDSFKQLWIATEGGGIEMYNRDKDNFDPGAFAPGSFTDASTDNFLGISEDRHKTLWFTGYSGVAYYDRTSKKIAQVLKGRGLEKYGIKSISHVTDDLYILLALPNKLFFWNKATDDLKEIQTVGSKGLPDIHNLADVKIDSSGNIWIAHTKGISRFFPETSTFENYIIPNPVKSINGLSVWSIYEDKNKILWLGTDGLGLMYFDPVTKSMGSYTNTASPASLSSPVVRTIFEDRAGDLWVNNFPIGVNHLDRSNNYISLYTNFIRNKEGTFKNQTWAIVEDEKHNLWLGVDNIGLVYFDRKANTFSRSYEGLNFSGPEFPNTVLSLLKDSHDNLWFGTWAQGIGRLNLKTREYKIYRPKNDGDPHSFPTANVWSIIETKNGKIYFGTNDDGFVVYDYKTDSFVMHRKNRDLPDDQALSADNVSYQWEDESGKIWMATNYGLVIYNPTTDRYQKFFKNVNKPGSLSQNWVSSFFKDSAGRMWVSTMGGGLNLWHPETETFTYIRANDGLASDDVLGVVEDRFGTLWISTRAGLTAMDPDKHTFTRYTDKNWLQKGEFDTGAFGVLSNGELVFGGEAGFNIFDPGKIVRNNYVAPIVFTELEIFGQPVHAGIKDSPLKHDIVNTDELVLNHEQNFFSLAFSTLNYRVYDDNRYQYILEGVDKEWHEPTATNRVTYMHLDAGKYIFKVKAANNSGIWSGTEKTLKIIVLPPLWRTWWAYTLYALTILSMAVWYMQTQRYKFRQAALLNAKLLELDKIKDNFMANTSHELRTPVNGILGMAHALREGDSAAEQLPAWAAEKVDVILSCGRRLARLVNHILDFSAISESQLLLNRGCVNLHNLLPQVIDECHIQHNNTAIKVENHLKPDLPLVFVDEARTLNIFYNIVSNAFKFTEQGFVKITASVTDSSVVIRVADTGVGIEKEDLTRIFLSFSQVANSGVNQKNGTGLGMAITKYLVELHGGSLSVESTKGVGSVFTVSLPRATEQQISEFNASRASTQQATLAARQSTPQAVIEANLSVFYPKSHAVNPQQGYSRILVVDDEPVNRMVLRQMLIGRNYIVYEAANGQEAVDAIEQGFQCDLILLDIMMPKLSGLDACKQIRHKYSSDRLPIIFVTARTQQQDRDECIAVGGNDFLTKPVANDDLYAHIDALMVRNNQQI